jgi:hypothetical protein
MSKHLIFMVHGMGTYKKNWSKDFFDQLRASYKTFDALSFDAFDDLFETTEIIYDDIFEDLRAKWKNKADEVIQVLTANGFEKSAANKLAEIASSADGSDFLRTHVLDVILYRFLPTIAEQLRNRVMKDIQLKLNSYAGPNVPRYSIIAHSLGTAVIAEAMHEWMTDAGWRDTPFASRFRPQNIFMVANVSRALWSLGGQYYQNAVRPFPTESKGGCGYYASYAHPLDPFTHVRPFDVPPDGWFFSGTDRAQVYGCPPIAVDDVCKLNVHALDHYLAHPLVHADIFLHLRQSTNLVSKDELDARLKDYYKTTLFGKKLVDARKLLTDFTLSDTESWSGILDGITRFRAMVDAVEGAGT